jgi:hypothetical protein
LLRRSISWRRPSRSKVPPQRLHALYEVLEFFSAFPGSHRSARGPTPVAWSCQRGLGRTGIPGRGKKRDAGVLRTGRLAKVAGRAGGLRPRKAPLGAHANPWWLRSCGLSLTRRRTPTSRFFPRPSIHIQLCRSVAPETTHKTAGGSASPKGEARREAPARQSEANAAPGRITGGGGRGGSTKPYPPTHPRSAAQHPRKHTPNSDTREGTICLVFAGAFRFTCRPWAVVDVSLLLCLPSRSLL